MNWVKLDDRWPADTLTGTYFWVKLTGHDEKVSALYNVLKKDNGEAECRFYPGNVEYWLDESGQELL